MCAGRQTILAFGAESRFMSESAARADENHSYAFASMAVVRWSSCYLDMVGNLIVLGAALFAVFTGRAGLSSSLVGLSVSYAFSVRYLLRFRSRVRALKDILVHLSAKGREASERKIFFRDGTSMRSSFKQ